MNYIQQALQTKSTSFHGDKVEFQLFYDTLANTIFNLQQLDKMKKSLFYGKDNFVVDNAHGTCNQLPVECLSEDDNSITGIDVLHAVLGIATEAGELLEAIQIGLFGEDGFDLVNVAEEVGDVFWYQAILANSAGKSFEEIQATNIAKLRARFPNKFTELDAQVRDLDKERVILEGHDTKDYGFSGGFYDAVLKEAKTPFIVEGEQVFINQATIGNCQVVPSPFTPHVRTEQDEEDDRLQDIANRERDEM